MYFDTCFSFQNVRAASTIGQRLHNMQMQALFTENSNSFACLAWEHRSNKKLA
jgi:hypothetical protein